MVYGFSILKSDSCFFLVTVQAILTVLGCRFQAPAANMHMLDWWLQRHNGLNVIMKNMEGAE